MKKIYSFFFVLAVAFCITAFRPIAEPFEGKIRYETFVTGEAPKLITDRLAKYYDLSFKGTDLKISGDAPLKGKILFKKNVGKMYIVRADQKNVYELDLKDKRIPEDTSTPPATRLKETITIAGYPCQKHQIQYGKDLKLFVWSTEAIHTDHGGAEIFGGQFKLPVGVNGFPLKLQFASSKFTITFTATVVNAASIDAIEFVLPAGMATKKL